jgi:hypothetical protein
MNYLLKNYELSTPPHHVQTELKKFKMDKKKNTWDPYWSQTTKRGTGNRSFMIELASSCGTFNNWANAW